MNQYKIYQVDTFTNTLFAGNPAAVCPLENWLSDETMQHIASENNLAETAFYIPKADNFHIRWFTPTTEVELCGHATLATAFVIFEQQNYDRQEIIFDSMSGKLEVKKEGNLLTLDFPTDTLHQLEYHADLAGGLGEKPLEIWKGNTDYLVIYSDEEQIINLNPDLRKLAQLTEVRAVIASAKGKNVDFISRVFAPQSGIDEDPVTGSAHTSLTPYWSKKLDKLALTAKQLSVRGGNLFCTLKNDRVEIAGEAKLYLEGTIYIA